MTRRLWWTAAAACICLSTSVLFARQGVIRTRDGKTIEGEIEERPDQVVVTIRGIKTAVNRDNIEGQVEYFDNVEARYQDKVSKLPAKPTADDHLALARWCFDVRQYDLALQEIEKARRIDPNNADAATLEQTVNAQRRLDKTRNTGAAAGTGTTPTTPRPGTGTAATPATGGPAAPGGYEKPRLLTADDVNIIRQMEWRENDNVIPRATVPAKVRKDFLDANALDPADFATRTPAQQAYIVLRDGTPEMRKEVRLTTDPQALVEYRRSVQPLVLNNCATVGCHGGHNAGRFYLHSTSPEREDVAYTNFYILQNYRQSFPGHEGEYAMVDRTYPDRSILAQFALAPEAAELKHPPIKGQAYRPIAANKSAPGYKAIVGWMRDLQAREPNYGIDYPLPTSSKKATPVTPKATDPKAAPPAKTGPAAGTGAGTGATGGGAATPAKTPPATINPTPTPPKSGAGSTNNPTGGTNNK